MSALSVLDRKVLRELWGMKGQALAIAMVLASGVATFVMSLSTLESLRQTQAAFYRDARFADVFAPLKRAPEETRRRIEAIPGVQLVQTRVLAEVTLDIPDFDDPATGRLVSVDHDGEPLLNQVYLRSGRMVQPGRAGEVVASEPFAEAHGFRPGDRLAAVINGRREELTIVGIALSPEYIYQIKPGAVFPDFESYGVMWMAREPLANAYDMDGAFNDVALTVAPGTPVEPVIDRLDLILERYGGIGAYAREDQTSHRFLSEEFRGLEFTATIFPTIFLGVSAFLLNIVMSRLIRTQREQVATLKAFGYRNLDVVVHFTKMVTVIVVLGSIIGLGLGVWLGRGMSRMYMEFYKFPYLRYTLPPWVASSGVLISLAAALIGTLYSVYRAASQPPAEAMRPEPPATYHRSVVEVLGLRRFLAQPTRMILRNIERTPLKSALTVLGISFALAILMVGLFFGDSVDFMIDVQYGLAQREDLSVSFVEPTSYGAYHELVSLPGVVHAEPFRAVPVELRNGHKSYETAIQGLRPGGDLYRLIDRDLESFPVPSAGVVLTDYLGTILDVAPGDTLTVDVKEGSRPQRQVQVAALVREYVGVSAYMDLDALNRLMREGSAISGAFLQVPSHRRDEVNELLEERPRVAGVTARLQAIDSFYETAGEQMLTFAFINTLLAAVIAVGVVYNSARIALSERGRELASLRVLGFRRGEVSYILLGELAVLTLVAIPVGFLVGWGLCAYVALAFQTDIFRIPLVIDPSTYSLSAAVVVVSAAISGLIVRHRIDHLDLIEVLKTRE